MVGIRIEFDSLAPADGGMARAGLDQVVSSPGDCRTVSGGLNQMVAPRHLWVT